jgi:mutator protein MutT
MSRQVDVAVGVLIERDDRGWQILITRRPNHVVYGGYWELPGGKVEAAESPRDCLVREFEEEVGLQIEVGAALSEVEHRYEHAHVRLHPFFCRRIAGEPRNLQVAEHRWVRMSELDDYKFPEANAPLMAEAREILGAPNSAELVR